MKYMLLIHQGTTPLPGTPEWEALSDEQKGAVYAGYQAVNETPGMTPGERMASPDTATTVRVQDGRALTTDGPMLKAILRLLEPQVLLPALTPWVSMLTVTLVPAGQ